MTHMGRSNDGLCEFCTIGYHAPFERFELVSAHQQGPTFLRRCKACGALWHETLRDATRVSVVEASSLYPDAPI